jgi:hypothetical protein
VNADHAGIAVVTGPTPTAATIAANASESGKLFGEEGYYAVIGQVRVELTNERGLLGHARKRTPRISYSGSSSSYEHDRPDVLSFEPPPPPPANPPPAPVASGPLTLAQATPLIVRYAIALAGVGMAVLLFVAGIALLRLSRSGRLLHLLWAWMKLPLALGAAAAYFFVVLDGQLTLSRGITPWTNAILTHPALFAPLLGAAYAVVVLIVMYLPSVRGYFRHSPARSE